mmetsp:Transcript_57780/g.95492  ORF Transcript_57780/g.95492 Transcript_57780/m.95492 type:complete len:221 (+) Transcript_57780:24-686(+)
MPKSKREQKVTLSKTQKKGRSRKESIINEIRECVDRFATIYVFAAHNMRNSALKDVRARLKSSRLFFGRNKLISAALGRTASDEYRDGLSAVAKELLGGEAGVLFTNESDAAVKQCIDDCQVPEFARAGFEATQEVTLPAGPISQFAGSQEPYLRKLGLPTRLQAGVVTLLGDHTVCRNCEELSSDQAKILQLLDIKMAIFQLSLTCRWSNGDFVTLRAR